MNVQLLLLSHCHESVWCSGQELEPANDSCVRVGEVLYSITIIIVIGGDCGDNGSGRRKDSSDAQQA